MRLGKLLRNFFKKVLVILTSVSLVFQGPLLTYLYGQAPAIVPDGRTQTVVTGNGSVTDVRTNSVSGINAYNSFDKFNVNAGNTTNLHVPDAAKNLVNLVHKERSQIDGVLNSYKNGKIGGNVFFLNPHGIVIGQGGVVNVGSLHLQTPTADYLEKLISKEGVVSAVHEQQLFSGNVPITPSGLITVKGKINAVNEIQIKAGNVSIDQNANVRAGRQVVVEFGDLVNIEGLNWGNDLLVTPEGKIKIVATNNVDIAGKVKTDATENNKAGKIEIKAGKDINVKQNADISAKGKGKNSDGGEIIIYADNNSTLEKNANINVAAGDSGKGGFLEFSATKNVNITGNGLISSSGGTILIDPEDIEWTDESVFGLTGSDQDVFTDGGNFILEASKSIYLTNVYISTRQVGDTRDRNTHAEGTSIGGSGNITLKAPKIYLTNSKLLAHATGTYKAGDVTIELTDNDFGSHFDFAGNAVVEFDMNEGSLITGNKISITAIAGSGLRIENDEEIEVAIDKEGNITGLGEKIVGYLTDVLDFAMERASALGATGRDNRAKSTITIGGNILADDSIEITSDAQASAHFTMMGAVIMGSGVKVTAESKIDIKDTATLIANAKAPAGVNPDEYESAGLTIISNTFTEIATGGEPSTTLNAIPFDVIFAFGVSESKNVIDIAAGAELTSAADITVEATSTRNHGIEVGGGSGESLLGLAVAVLVGDAETKINVNGTLEADGNITIAATTETEGNNLAAGIGMSDEDFDTGGWDKIGEAQEAIKNDIKAPFVKLWEKFKEKVLHKKATANNPFKQLGLAGSLAILNDGISTDVIIGGDATLIGGGDIEITAATINSITVSTTSSVGAYDNFQGKDSEGEDISESMKKDNAIAFSIPMIFMENNAKVIVESGADITSSGNVAIDSSTTIEYSLDHPLYNFINDYIEKNNDETILTEGKQNEIGVSGILDLYSVPFDSQLGIEGFFNTWSQSTAAGDNLGAALMLTLISLNNNAITQIEGNITIDGDEVTFDEENNPIPKLKVNATNNIEYGNLVGSFNSFLARLPGAPDAFGSDKPEGNTPPDENAEPEDKGPILQAMYGNEGKNAVGAALLGSFVNNTAIARIDGGTISVDGSTGIEVTANNNMLEIGATLGGGQAKNVGIEGMFGVGYYDSYTLAKIDDAAKITADSVAINAIDDYVFVGVAGGFIEGASGIGLSGIVSISDRQSHAVWGNLLNKDGSLAKIKGDSAAETIASSVSNSIVTGDVEVIAEMTGLNITLAAAGSARMKETPEGEVPDVPEPPDPAAPDKDDNEVSFADMMQWLFDDGDKEEEKSEETKKIEEATKTAESTSNDQNESTPENEQPKTGLGVAGAAAVNVLSETVTAGISGNVTITAGDVSVHALNKMIDASIVGGLVVQLDGDKNNGFAGAFGVNILDGETVAYIQPNTKTAANQISFANLDVKAQRSGQIITASLGGSGTTAMQGTQIAGSVSVNILQDDTILNIKNANLAGTDAITANAADSAWIVAVSGGIAFGGKTAVGLGLSGNYLNMNTRANIYNSTIDANKLSLGSSNESSIITIALGGAVGNNNAVGGTIAVVISGGKTLTTIENSNIDLDGSLVVTATSKAKAGSGRTFYDDLVDKLQAAEEGTEFLSDDGETLDTREENGDGENTELALDLASASPKIVTAALAIGISNNAIGVNLGLNVLTDVTNVSISGSTIASGNDATIAALTEGGVIAVGVGIAGGAGGFGVAGNVAVNLVGGSTTVDLLDNTSISATNTLSAKALNAAGITDIAINLAGGTSAGVAASLAYNQVAHKTLVNISGSEVNAGAVDIDVINSASIISALVSVGAGGTAGVGVSFAINTIGSLTGSELGQTIENYNGEQTKDEEIKARGNLAEKFGGNGIGDIFETIGSSQNITEINISNSTITAGTGGIDLNVTSSGRLISVAVGLGFGGSAGVGAAGAYNNIGGSTGIFAKDADLESGTDGITADSLSSNGIIAVSFGGGGGGGAGVGVGAAVNNLSANNAVKFENTNSDAEGSISLNAKNSGKILSVAGSIAGGGAAGVGVAVTVNLLKGNTLAEIVGGITNSTGGNGVSVKAENTSNILSVAASGAGGGGAGVAGSVAVNYLKNTTLAKIGKTGSTTTVNAKTGINVDALSSGKILSIGGGIAGGGAAGVAGSVATNFIRSKTGTYLENANLTANSSGSGSFHALAESNNDIKNIIVNGAGGGAAGVAVIVGVNDIGGTTETIAKGATIKAANIDLLSKNTSNTFGVTVVLAGGGIAGVGVATDVHLLNQTVATKIENTASNTLTASGDVAIKAEDLKAVTSNAVGLAVGGVAGVNGSISTVVTSGTTLVDLVTAKITADGNIAINSNSATELNQITGSIAGSGVAGVALSVAVNVIQQNATVQSNASTELKSNNANVDIQGYSKFDIKHIDAYSVGAGIAGVAGAVVVTTIADSVNVNIGGSISAKNVNLKAIGDFIVNDSRVGGVGAGAVGVAAGIDVIVVKNRVALSSSANIVATSTAANSGITFEAKQKRDIDQTTVAAGAGLFGGLGMTVSVINMGGSIDDKNQETFSASVDKTGEIFNEKSSGEAGLSWSDIMGLTKPTTASLEINGSLTAKNITANAGVENTIQQDALGAGVGGFAGVGAAVGIITAKDNIETKIGNGSNITLGATDRITINSLAYENGITQNIIAGGAGGLGLGAAVGVLDISGDVKTIVGNNATLKTTTSQLSGNTPVYNILLTAGRDIRSVNLDVTSAAIGTVGLSAAVHHTNFSGTSEVKVNDGAKILAKYVNLKAADSYTNYDSYVWGGSGGAYSGAGAVDVIHINGTTNVAIGNNAKIGIETGTPDTSLDRIFLESYSEINGFNSFAKMIGAGIAAAGASDATAFITFDTNINLDGATLRSGDINLLANSKVSNFDLLTTSDTYGGAGLPFAFSQTNLTENAKINLTGTNLLLEAEHLVNLNAGQSTNDNVKTTSYLYNYTAIPLNTAPDAVTNIKRDDDISISGGTIKSVSDILLYTGQGTDNITTYSEGTNSYIATLEAIGDFFGADWSLTIEGGKTNKYYSNDVTFTNANLEAGSHYNSFVTIDTNGNVTSSPWITVSSNNNSPSLYNKFADRIAELQAKIALANLFKTGNGGVYGDIDAYEIEIQMLENQLAYYMINKSGSATDPNNYVTAQFITLSGDINASSGDIVIKGKTTAGAGTTLTAHADPSITITNNSSKFLQLSGNIKIAPRIGGRITVDGNIVSDANANSLGFNGASRNATGSGTVADPIIKILNTHYGPGGNNLSTELWFVEGSYISNINGKIDIESKGSIWVFDSSISARDIAIKTDGSFFQGYQDGLVNVGNNPLGIRTEIYQSILGWMNSMMLFGGSGNLTIVTEQLNAAKAALEAASTPESWQAFTTTGGSTNYSLLVPKADGEKTAVSNYNTAKANYNTKQPLYETAVKNLDTYVTALRTNSSNFTDVFKEEEVEVTSPVDGTKSKITKLTLKPDKSVTDLKPIIEKNDQDVETKNTTTDLDTAKVNYANAKTTIEEFPDIITAYSAATTAYEATNFKTTYITNYTNKLSEFNAADSNIGTGSAGSNVLLALKDYSFAVDDLQQRSTTESWNAVFGVSGSHDISKLVAKTGVSDLDSKKAAYTQKLTAYNTAITNATDAYVKSQIQWFGDVGKSLASDATSTTAISTATMPESSGMIYGGRSVFISAETLNVNGTVKSGTLETIIDLTSEAVNTAINQASGDNVNITEAVFGKDRIWSALPQVILNKTSNYIEISDIQAMGGDITLYGNIISTGGGKLEVADGYGNVEITGRSDYDLVLGTVDTGLGSEGTIRIVDTAYRTETNTTPKTTIYTRSLNSNGQSVINVQNDGQNQSAIATTSTYNPKAGRWLKNVTGNKYDLEWNYYYDKDYTIIAWSEIDAFSKDPGNRLGGSGGKATLSQLPTGTFLVEMPIDEKFNGGNVLVGELTRTASNVTTDTKPDRCIIYNCNWIGTGWSRYRSDTIKTQTFTDVFESYLNASQAIGINFVGEQNINNAGSIGIDITGARSVVFKDLVRSVDDVKVTASGNIASFAEGGKTPLITAKEISLTAGGNIGSYNNLNDAKNVSGTPNALAIEAAFGGTRLSAIAGNNSNNDKDVNLLVTGDDLRINAVKGKDVTINASGNVIMNADTNDGITATHDLNLTAGIGRIGGASDNTSSQFKFNVANNTKISASGNIYAKFTGDLNVDSIISEGGDIYLDITGSVFDRNKNETDDPLSDFETKSAFWAEIGLTEGAANELKKTNIIAAYKNAKENDYFDAWKAIDYDINNYDENYSFTFGSVERTGLTNAGWTEQQITDEQLRRTNNYHSFLANGSATYNSSYSYTVTEEERTSLTANATWSVNQLKNDVAAGVFFMLNDAGDRQNTTSKIEDPNISGKDITIIAGGSIGKSDADSTVTISRGENAAGLDDTEKRALADAEYDDVTYYNSLNVEITDFAGLGKNSVSKIVVKSFDNLNILASGKLRLQSGSGWTNVGSQGDIKIDNSINGNGIKSGTGGDQALRLKTDGAIYAVNNTNTAIYAKNAVLEAAGGTLGKISEQGAIIPLKINLTGTTTNGWLTARANEGVYLEASSAVYLREISSQGEINLTAAGIYDALNTSNAKIGGVNITLTATNGSIGDVNNWLPIALVDGGTLQLSATQNIYVNNPTGSLNVTSFSAGGNVSLKAETDLLLNITGNVSAATTNLQSVHGDLIIAGGSLGLGSSALTATSAKDILISAAITAGNTTLTATDNLTINGNSFTANGTLTATAKNILIDTVNTTAGATSLTNTGSDSNIVITGGSAQFDSVNFNSVKDILISNLSNFAVTGDYTALAAENILISDVVTSAGTTNLTASNGKLEITGGSFTGSSSLTATAKTNLLIDSVATSAGTTNLTAQTGNLTIQNGSLNAGQFNATAEIDLLINNVVTNAGITNLTASTGKLEITGGSAQFATATLDSATDISISDLTNFAVTGNYNATAANNLSINNVATTAGTTNLIATAGSLTISGKSLTAANLTATANDNLEISNVATTAAGTTNLTAETGNLTITNGSLNAGSNSLTATAEKDLTITNAATTAGITTLTAKTGDLTINGGNATFENAILTAKNNVALINNNITNINGATTNAEDDAITINAGNNILSGGEIKVAQNKVTFTALNGKILDQNGATINLDANNSYVTLTAKNGIGAGDAFELKADTINLYVTDEGAISINALDDILLNVAETQKGLIDFNIQGDVAVNKVTANGDTSDFVLGATGNVTFNQNSKIEAGQRIVIVAEKGDIYSAATGENNAVTFDSQSNNFIAITGKIYGNATQNNGFITSFDKGRTNFVSNKNLSVYEVSINEIDYGTVVAGGQISILSKGDGGITIQKIVANKIDFNQGIVKLSNLTDEYYADVAAVIGGDIGKIITQNNALFSNQFEIRVEEIMITNNKPGSEFEMGDTEIRSETNIIIAWDNFTIEQIIAGINSSLTHIGGSKEFADYTLVKNINSRGDFIIKNMKSNEVYVFSEDINGVLHTINSINGNHANYDINGVSLVIDAVEKERSKYYSFFDQQDKFPDFRVWTLDGTYDFDLSGEMLALNNNQLRVLYALNNTIILDNNTTYADGAFDNVLVEDRRVAEGFINNIINAENKIALNNPINIPQTENLITGYWLPQTQNININLNLDNAITPINNINNNINNNTETINNNNNINNNNPATNNTNNNPNEEEEEEEEEE
ncbi:MAG: leukotoxin LktA family filamentous adhesin [Planctomycetaceae bacterium]|jgi:hypothetical protein|nr:leukotoxin LktA family filamentous adhesin [Planctomycetaceae bacterium]